MAVAIQRWRDFLSLSVEERNQAIELSSEIRRELRQHFTLKELDLGASSWEDVDLKTLLNLRQERLFEAMAKKHVSPRQVLGNMRDLHAIIATEASRPSMNSRMEDWMEYRYLQ
ncbi:MAG: hypothetical protein HY619_00600 [Thaumarchaeota archaeon]|nr:hypothetical protein [Nitrososphaerota archaeon]